MKTILDKIEEYVEGRDWAAKADADRQIEKLDQFIYSMQQKYGKEWKTKMTDLEKQSYYFYHDNVNWDATD